MNVYTDNHLTPAPWTRDALCAETDPDVFFGDDGLHAVEAKEICGRCPVIADCYVAAQELKPQWRIWAGKSVRQLADARKKARET